MFVLLAGCPPEPEGPTGDPSVDADGDGVFADVDCDDSDPLRFPGAPERCNGLDDDCDGLLARNEEDELGLGAPDCAACDDAGLWVQTAEIEDPNELRSILRDATDSLNTCDYNEARRYMFTRVDKVDGVVEGVYTGFTLAVGSATPNPDVMNTEHTWPQSQGAGQPPAECDIHHLYPTATEANTARGSYPFGEVVSGVSWSDGGSVRGRDSAGNVVFEPRDSHKGNVARSMFYFALVYGYTLTPSQVALFESWAELDPQDLREHDRSFAIAEYQSHVNPFAVCPGLAARVF